MVSGAPILWHRTALCLSVLQFLVVLFGCRKYRKPDKLLDLLRTDKATEKYCFGVIIYALLQ